MSGKLQIAAIVGVLLFGGSTNSLAEPSSASGAGIHWNGSRAADVPAQFAHRCKHHKHRQACDLNETFYPQRY